MALRVIVPAIVLALFGGCTTSSILSDADQQYSWLPSHTSYDRLTDQCAGKRVAIVFRNGWIREGYLVHASPDSISWCAEPNSPPECFATIDLVRISEPMHLIPAIAGTVLGAAVGVVIGTAAAFPAGESGGAHPVSPPEWPAITLGAAGAVGGYFVGRGNPAHREYIIDTAAARDTRATGGTR